MKLFKFGLLLIALHSSVSYGQDDYLVDSLRFQFPMHRNEVFTNLTPFAVVAMASEPIVPRFSLGFQRAIKPNMNIRVWANYEIVANYKEERTDGDVIPTGPGTFYFDLDEEYDEIYDLRFGVSWFKPDQRITAEYGVDLFFGTRERELINKQIPYALDTSLCAQCYVPSPLVAATEDRRTERYYIAGFDFSVSALFKASKRMWLRLQWTPQLAYYSLYDEELSNPGLRSEALNPGLNFHLRGIELFAGLRF